MNAATLLTTAAAEHGDLPAVRLDDVVLDYAALDAATQRFAGALRGMGVAPGDRVGLVMPNLPFFPIIYYGALRAGAVLVPMNPLLKAREVEFHVTDSGAQHLFAWEGMAEDAAAGAKAAGIGFTSVGADSFGELLAGAEPLEEVVERDDQDAAVIIYTSGTTGTPKGATLTHHNLLDGAEVGAQLADLGPGSVTLGALPLFHVFGMNSGLNATVKGAGLLTLVPRFDAAKVLEVLERDAVTSFLGVPTMYVALLNDPSREGRTITTLEICVSGGAAMPVEVLKGFEEAFGCKVLEGYGLSETTGMATFNPRDRERKPGSIGLPVRGVELRIVDEQDEDVGEDGVGEVVLKSPHLMKGYWGRDDATEEVMRGGWFHTGDMARFDEEGYVFIVDRKKDLIIRGGYNVYPREVEEVLYEHPAVMEAAVVGVPDDALGEEVGAAVALKAGESVSEDELRAFVKERVAGYKYPRRVWLVDELPKGPTGKVLKREITVPEG